MSDHVHIEGLGAYDGDHPLDVSYFTNRELHLIKELSGVRAGELDEAFKKQDNDLFVALAAIGLQRAGHKVEIDALWDAQVGVIQLVLGDEEEADAGPPSQPPSEPGTSESGSENKLSSGSGSLNGGDPLPRDPSPTGSQGSDTGATSDPVTSET